MLRIIDLFILIKNINLLKKWDNYMQRLCYYLTKEIMNFILFGQKININHIEFILIFIIHHQEEEKELEIFIR